MKADRLAMTLGAALLGCFVLSDVADACEREVRRYNTLSRQYNADKMRLGCENPAITQRMIAQVTEMRALLPTTSRCRGWAGGVSAGELTKMLSMLNGFAESCRERQREAARRTELGIQRPPQVAIPPSPGNAPSYPKSPSVPARTDEPRNVPTYRPPASPPPSHPSAAPRTVSPELDAQRNRLAMLQKMWGAIASMPEGPEKEARKATYNQIREQVIANRARTDDSRNVPSCVHNAAGQLVGPGCMDHGAASPPPSGANPGASARTVSPDLDARRKRLELLQKMWGAIESMPEGSEKEAQKVRYNQFRDQVIAGSAHSAARNAPSINPACTLSPAEHLELAARHVTDAREAEAVAKSASNYQNWSIVHFAVNYAATHYNCAGDVERYNIFVGWENRLLAYLRTIETTPNRYVPPHKESLPDPRNDISKHCPTLLAQLQALRAAGQPRTRTAAVEVRLAANGCRIPQEAGSKRVSRFPCAHARAQLEGEGASKAEIDELIRKAGVQCDRG